MKNKPELKANEEVILTNPGFYKDNLRSGWKPGHLYLTNERLFLWQPTRIIFQTLVENIKEISVQQRGFILRSKDALCISYGESSKAWIMVKDVETWKNRIFERSLLEINQEKIDKIIKELDPESQNILLFVWQNRHASINELAQTYNAVNHMDVLHRIRNIINPTSQKLIGFPVLVFERSKIDEPTGKKVMFSWWIIGGDKLSAFGAKVDRKESLLDIFDEGDHLNIIMELKGAKIEDILLGVDADKLIVSCKTPEANYYEEISLPAKVESEEIMKRYHNNILEVRLQKLIPKRLNADDRT
ncbi:MAG: Hsp20/alpha crystallin family protein [Thermodesulfovibrionales bacterium]|nr:Hsp20/alpha crystallin family protein [Thermodesulfovibrionales bacterium]